LPNNVCPGLPENVGPDRIVKKIGGALRGAGEVASLLGPFSCQQQPPTENTSNPDRTGESMRNDLRPAAWLLLGMLAFSALAYLIVARP